MEFLDLREIDKMKRAEFYVFDFAQKLLLVNVENSMCYETDALTLDALRMVHGGLRVTDALVKLAAMYPRQKVLAAMRTLVGRGFFYDTLGQPPLVAPAYDDAMKIGGTNINVTHMCNLRCAYCYGDSAICPSGIGPEFWGAQSSMSLSTARRVVDFLVREGNQSVAISFFGGEPLLNYPAIEEIMAYADRATDRYGIRLGMGLFTNGTLIDQRIVELLNRHHSGVTLSVDGPAEAHDKNRPDADGRGTWATVMDKVELLRESLHPGVYEFRGSFAKSQVEDGISLLDYIRVAQEHGAQMLWAVPIVQHGCNGALTEDDIPYLRREYERAAMYMVERFGATGELPLFRNIVDRMRKTRFIAERPEFSECGAARGFVCPAPDGSIYGCHQLTGLDEWRMGHVFGGFSREKTREVCRNARVSDACPDCGLRYFCGLGCLKNKINATGSAYTPDRGIECEVMKLEIEAAFFVNSMLPTVLDSQTFRHIWGPESELYRKILSLC